jgi:hypothetical protein
MAEGGSGYRLVSQFSARISISSQSTSLEFKTDKRIGQGSFKKSSDKKHFFGVERAATLLISSNAVFNPKFESQKSYSSASSAVLKYELIDNQIRIIFIAKTVEAAFRQASFTKAMFFICRYL